MKTIVSNKQSWFNKIKLTKNDEVYVGIDVHDVGVNQRPLQPGMTFAMEPGIYIRVSALETLPNTPENAAFSEKVRPAVEKYKDIGIRIEDSFLVTDTGLECLSPGVPRTIDEVEAFLNAPGVRP